MSNDDFKSVKQPKKVSNLRELSLTRIVDEDHLDAIAICHQNREPYFVAELSAKEEYYGMEFANWVNFKYPDFSVPLDRAGAPWAEAVAYLLDWCVDRPYPNMGSLANKARDLATYRHFLDEKNIAWDSFPKVKLMRPTYRFRAHLKKTVDQGANLASARRCMSTVVAMYRWAINSKMLSPAYPAWEEKRKNRTVSNNYGKESSFTIESTDLTIYDAPAPESDFIYDGGKLRPLEKTEQELLMQALQRCGNTEITLMHVFALATGARLQTVGTLRVKHIRHAKGPDVAGCARVLAGPGTGIDTKNNKRGTLFVPWWLVLRMRAYVESARAKRRRDLNAGGDTDEQLVFLTPGGEPFYSPKSFGITVAGAPISRRRRVGKSLHQYIRDAVSVAMASLNGGKPVPYKFHWTRATFGMNYMDAQIELVNQGSITLATALARVQERMWHNDLTTTNQYLNYRTNASQIASVQGAFEEHLQQLIEGAFDGGSEDDI